MLKTFETIGLFQAQELFGALKFYRFRQEFGQSILVAAGLCALCSARVTGWGCLDRGSSLRCNPPT